MELGNMYVECTTLKQYTMKQQFGYGHVKTQRTIHNETIMELGNMYVESVKTLWMLEKILSYMGTDESV